MDRLSRHKGQKKPASPKKRKNTALQQHAAEIARIPSFLKSTLPKEGVSINAVIESLLKNGVILQCKNYEWTVFVVADWLKRNGYKRHNVREQGGRWKIGRLSPQAEKRLKAYLAKTASGEKSRFPAAKTVATVS